MTGIIKLIKANGYKPYEIAEQLGIAVTQLYKWEKEGISEKNRYYPALKLMFPELEPTKLHKTKRYNSGRKPAELNLTETDIPVPPEERPRPSEFPKVKFRKKK